MNGDFKYNSQALKEEFRDFYKDFFSTCATVTSAPGNFLWAGNYGLLSGSLGISQNLPLRVYLGLEETSGEQIIFDKCFCFDCSNRKFISYEMSDSLKDELVAFLSQEIKNICGNKTFKGLRIHTIAEMQISYGVNASGAFAAALASALFIHYKKTTPEMLSVNIAKQPIVELMKNNIFDQLFRLAWKIEAIFHGGVTSGMGAFTAFIASRSPICYFIEPPKTQINQINFSCDIGQTEIKNYDIINQLSYGAFRLNELSRDSGDFFFPFDFGLISSGTSGAAVIANRSLKNFENDLSGTTEYFQKELYPFLQNPFFKCLPRFTNIFAEGGIHKTWNAFLLTIAYLSINTLAALQKLNQKYLSPPDFLRLIKTMNQSQSIYRLINIVSSSTEQLYSLLEYKCRRILDEYGVGLKLTNNTHGGYIIFALAYQKLREKIFKIVEEARQESDEPLSIDWMSWRDGLENKGILVEQSLNNKLYSEFIAKGAVQVLHLDHYGLHEDLYTLDEFSKVKANMDVILDSLRGEIWMRGEKLTSKDLRTASHTIQVMKILLENIGVELSKNQLPPSSYLQDRNEFQSKIASPLVKAIEKRLQRRISFNVQGEIVNFTVKFDPNNIEFHYINQEF